VPEVPPVNMSGLIPMAVKEEHQEANSLALNTITERGLVWAAEKAESKAARRERIAREEAEKGYYGEKAQGRDSTGPCARVSVIRLCVYTVEQQLCCGSY
jgi:hypothetical protein